MKIICLFGLLSLFLGHLGFGQHNAKPNILLIISDDLNTKIGPYMNVDQYTPNLDRLAGEGIRFSRAFSQFPLCGPSRASLMSGLYPESNGVVSNNDQPGSYRKGTPALANHPSMVGFFRERGYFTARVSKIYHMGVPGGIERGEPGGDEPDSWDYAYNVMGPETMSQGSMELLSPKNKHYGSNFAQMVLADSLAGTQTDYLAASQAIAILENRAGKIPEGATNMQRIKRDEPFFLAVGFVRPHVPFIAPQSSFARHRPEDVTLPTYVVGDNVPAQALTRQNEKVWGMDELQQKKTVAAYMASVRFMDQQVGRLLDALDRLNLKEKTIVIFMSDHGYNLGEHGSWSKTSLWEGTVAAPLIISVPGEDFEGARGSTYSGITELIDLYPTLVDLGGFAGQQPGILQGQSLAAILQGMRPEKQKDHAYSITVGGGATVRTSEWRYTRWGEEAEGTNEELYHHVTDPEEHVNLVDKPEMQQEVAALRRIFEAVRTDARSGPKHLL
ncbi:MAG: sulfatase [Lunatimonas sp.]|uniref:sulfatase n=1 Tax=Lunatimonas sp. TaxID=2060141 RepID=UPI00263B0674|nr:sulfatase [Lunatimonas sp.]MCC5938238.1 sulfatase [Lunatimonas sp.]